MHCSEPSLSPAIQDILTLDLLTLREHTERAGDALDPQRMRESLQRLLPISEVAAVRRSDALVAYAMLQPQTVSQWFVTGFGTHPEHRNASVLRDLLGQVVDIAARRGIKQLQSHVYKTNQLSMAFHARLGFKVTRENAKGVEFTGQLIELMARSAWLARRAGDALFDQPNTAP